MAFLFSPIPTYSSDSCSNYFIKIPYKKTSADREITSFLVNGVEQISAVTIEETDSLNGFINFTGTKGFAVTVEVRFTLSGEPTYKQKKLYNVRKFVNTHIQASITNTPLGANLTINIEDDITTELDTNTNVYTSGYTYSLDNVTFQSSNVFSGLAAGTYTVYLRDFYGCVRNTSVTVTGFEENGVSTRRQVAQLPSMSNSLAFHRQDVIDNDNIFNNDTNRNQLNRINYCEKQVFSNSDIIKTQIKTSYENVTVKAIDCEGNETALTVNQISQNLQKDSRDCAAYIYDDGLTGIYFTSGSTYDYDSGLEIGSYSLGGALPTFAYVGNYIYIFNNWYQIVNKVYDEDVNSEVIIIEDTETRSGNYIVSSVYNYFGYDVFEFEVDCSLLPDSEFKVVIELTDSEYSDVSFITQKVCTTDDLDYYVTIDYSNSENTDIFYSSGITFRLRTKLEYMEDSTNQENDTISTDDNSYLLDSELIECNTFFFSMLTLEMMRKLRVALSHDTVTINGEGYVKDSDFEVTNLKGTNLYNLSAKMRKTNLDNNTNLDYFTGTTTDAINLVDYSDVNFIEY